MPKGARSCRGGRRRLSATCWCAAAYILKGYFHGEGGDPLRAGWVSHGRRSGTLDPDG